MAWFTSIRKNVRREKKPRYLNKSYVYFQKLFICADTLNVANRAHSNCAINTSVTACWKGLGNCSNSISLSLSATVAVARRKNILLPQRWLKAVYLSVWLVDPIKHNLQDLLPEPISRSLLGKKTQKSIGGGRGATGVKMLMLTLSNLLLDGF